MAVTSRRRRKTEGSGSASGSCSPRSLRLLARRHQRTRRKPSTPFHRVELLHVFLRCRHEALHVLVEYLDVVGVAVIDQRALLERRVDDLVIGLLALDGIELAARAV